MKVKIEKIDHFGNGIAKIDDKVIFVDRALLNEVVDVTIYKSKKNFSFARINNIIEKSESRTNSICKYYQKCGACNFNHTSNRYERNFKINKCLELLSRMDNYYDNTLNYRNKVTLHVRNNKLGLYEEETHKLIEIDYCYLLNDKINDVIKELKEYLKNNKCNIKEIIIRTNDIETLVFINGNVDKNIIKLNIDNIVVNNKILKGNNYLIMNINDYKFKVMNSAFFQVSNKGLINIANIIDRNLNKEKLDLALDLYSGISTWGILISKYFNKVVSIEYNSDSTKSANENIKLNKIKNLEVINGKVEDYIDNYNNCDLVIIDPPRAGLDNKTIDNLLRINSNKIIYISCDMMTLKRDLEKLKEKYEIKEIDLVNMFNRTYHVETVCVLERK